MSKSRRKRNARVRKAREKVKQVEVWIRDKVEQYRKRADVLGYEQPAKPTE